MKLRKEFKNGILIFLGITLYFLAMEALKLSSVYYLRLLNIFIVLFVVNKTIQSNIEEGKVDYFQNIISGGLTSFVGVFLSVFGLRQYIMLRGGAEYIKQLSDAFLFGNNPTVNEYCIGLFFEGIASSVIATFILMQYWKSRTAVD
jgi:hypothetical protein